jgi:predicted DsbA family dithiol-disulfide isomerase
MRQLGISAVPTFIINDQYSISGGQPVAAFRQALAQIQAETSGA